MRTFALLLALFVSIASNGFANETIKLAIGDWAPYTSENDPNGKLAEIIVTQAFKLEGVDVVYHYYPWKRSYQYVEKGKYDGTFPWNKTPEREKEFYIHKNGIIKDEGVFFHLKSNPFDWKTDKDLKKYRLGVTVGFKAVENYKKRGLNADLASSEDENFRKLLLGRIDAYETSKIVGYTLINKLFTPGQARLFTHHPKIIETNEYFILFAHNPRGKIFAEKFDKGLARYKASGRYEKVVAQYLRGGH